MKKLAFSTQLVLYIVVFGSILVFVNLFAQQYHKRFDLTSEKQYTLSPQTIKVLKHLRQKINIIGFFATGMERNKAQELLEQYVYYCKKIKYRFIDPDRYPLEARKYHVTQYNVLVLESGKRKEQVDEISEQSLTNAIIRLSRAKTKVIYFLLGHGEHDINDTGKNGYSQFKEVLNNKGFRAESLWLVKRPQVPQDAALVVVGGPQKEILTGEIKKLQSYLQKGGHILFLIDPQTSSGLKSFLKKMGIRLDDDIIVDKMSRLFGGDYLIPVIVRFNPNHPITRGFKLACFFPLARSVRLLSNLPKGIQAELLAWTSEKAWGETNIKLIEDENKAMFDKNDVPGPVSVAVSAWKKGGFKIVVVGDSDFINNTYFNLSGNKDLALNMISWLGEESDLISIPTKKVKAAPLALSRNQAQLIFWVPVVIMPLFVLGIGIAVYWRRRRL